MPSSYFSYINPVPGFSDYTGPHKVGTIDVEIPISELDSPSPALDPSSPAGSLTTVQYRIFYPCESDSKGKSIKWVPEPQRQWLSAYSRFLGAGSKLAEAIS